MTKDFHRFSVGSFECACLKDGEKEYTLSEIFANAPEDEVRRHLRAKDMRDDVVITPYTYLHVDTGGREILVDAGAGRLFPSTGRLLQSMEAAEIDPEAIDMVIITHAHPDHVGGMLLEDSSPAFPNATCVISKREWDYWHSDRERDLRTSEQRWFFDFARSRLDPLRDRTRIVELGREEGLLLPGVALRSAPGHTPGHMVVELSSGGESLFYIGDAVILPIHLEEPTWHPVYDIDVAAAEASKRFIFDRAADRRSWVVGQHFPPFPSLGHVTRRDGGWTWQPVEIGKPAGEGAAGVRS